MAATVWSLQHVLGGDLRAVVALDALEPELDLHLDVLEESLELFDAALLVDVPQRLVLRAVGDDREPVLGEHLGELACVGRTLRTLLGARLPFLGLLARAAADVEARAEREDHAQA